MAEHVWITGWLLGTPLPAYRANRWIKPIFQTLQDGKQTAWMGRAYLNCISRLSHGSFAGISLRGQALHELAMLLQRLPQSRDLLPMLLYVRCLQASKHPVWSCGCTHLMGVCKSAKGPTSYNDKHPAYYG